MKIWISALRIRQWYKQTLVVLPLIALGNEVRVSDVAGLICMAMAFSFVASAVYLFNDLQDLETDRFDPVKSDRPLVKGFVSTTNVTIVGIVLTLMGFLVAFGTASSVSRTQVIGLLFFYLISNLFYSKFHLKKHRIVGIVIVALGFAIRFSIGTAFLELDFSTWAFVLIVQLAMFMLSGKRFQTILRNPPPDFREQELQFWLLTMITFAALFAATYSGFLNDPQVVAIWGKEALIISALPLGIGLVRFVELVTHPQKYKDADVTESMIKDLLLLLLVLCFVLVLFLGRINV
jgi:decaprenyl-phosphate phosphoribosyltransferase